MAFADLPEYEDPTFDHPKDPSEKLDYSYDFAKLVGDMTVSNPTVECNDAALLISNVVQSQTGAIVSCFIAGGEAGQKYDVRFGIECEDGRNFERTVRLYVKER